MFYLASLDLTAPLIVRINRHFGMADADHPPCWVAFKEANTRYGEIEAKIKARLGFDGTTSGTLYGSWEREIHHNDAKANLEEFMEVPSYLSYYETQIVYYVEYIQRSRKAGMDRRISGWSPSGITINYNYLAADAGDDQTVDVNTPVTFDGSASCVPAGRTIASYSWDFGPDATPATGTGDSPSCTYSTHGEKTVTLTVTDSGGDTDSDTMIVTVKTPPVADAGDDQTVELDSNTNSVSVSFDGSNSYDPDGGPLTYEWSFGDGSTDTGATPFHTYTAPGTYSVKLTVTDDEQVDASDTMTVAVKTPPVAVAGGDKEVYFNSTTNSVRVDFDGSKSHDPDDGTNPGDGIVSYGWSFGDGSTGSGATPSHTYTALGTYTAILTVTDNEQVDASDSLTVTVQPDPGVLTAEAGPNQTVSVDSTVNFDGSGSYAPLGRTIDTYDWDFGDGTSGSGIQATHTYSTHGEKTVTLTVTDSGFDADSDTMIVTVKAPPVADAGSDKEVYLSSSANSVSVSFDGSNSYDPDGGTLTYAWSFGDGSTSSGATPSHTYTSTGTYTVELTVTDDEQVEASDSLTVTVQPDPGVLTAGSGPAQTVDVGTIVTFDGSGSYAPAGRTITSYSWDFGSDATPATGTGVSPSCVYTTHGAKTVTLTVTDSGGDSDSNTMTVTVQAPPVADAGDDQTVEFDSNTNSVSVSFDGSNSYDPDGRILTYDWSFGDGSTGSGATPSYTYTSAGTYAVTLTVTDDENKTGSDTMTVTVQTPPPVADAGDDQTVELDSNTNLVSVSFDGSNSYDPDGGTLTYTWSFGDGSTGSGVMPSHTYTSAGTFTVTLTVTDDEYQAGSDTAMVTVQSPPPVADAGDDLTVELDSNTNSVGVSFDGSASYDPDGGTLAYAWSFGDGSTGSGATPSHTYTSTGTYTVTLTVTDDENGIGSDTVTITVQAAPSDDVVVDAGEDITIPFVAGGNTISFDGSGSYAPAGRTIDAYAWNFGDETSDTGVQATHTYTTPGAYTVKLTVTDDQDNVVSDSLLVTLFQGTVRISNNGLARSTPSPSPTPDPTPTATIDYTVVPERTDFTPTSACIEICNSQGTLVKEYSLTNSTANSYTTSWDGTDNDGVPVPDGGYSVVGVVTHQANSHRSAAQTMSVSGSGGSTHVQILPESSSYLAVNTELPESGTSGADEQSTSSPSAALIVYSITLANNLTESDVSSITLEIRAEDGTLIKSISLLDNGVKPRLETNWDGRGNTNGYAYGTHNARIRVDVSVEGSNGQTVVIPEYSNPHAIAVYSYPVADAGPDQIVDIDPGTRKADVPFDGSGSVDPDDVGDPRAGIAEYSWDFSAPKAADAGTPSSAKGSKPTASTEYSTVGEKTVTLTVTDNDPSPPLPDSDTVQVTVIKLSLDKPKIITRGDDVTFRAIVEPSGLNLEPTFSWKYTVVLGTDANGNKQLWEKTADTESANAWGGKMVRDGRMEFTANIGNDTFTYGEDITIDQRPWKDSFQAGATPNKGDDNLPDKPWEYWQVARTVICKPRLNVVIRTVSTGPNAEWMYIHGEPLIGTWTHAAYINDVVRDPGSVFYQFNELHWHAKGINRYMNLLNENILIHEGIVIELPHESHTSKARDTLAQTPINPLTESMTELSSSTQTEAVFKTAVKKEVLARVEIISIAAGKNGWHPTNKHPVPYPALFPDPKN